MKRFVLFVFLLICVHLAWSQYQPVPGSQWFTISTPHFRVHYAENNQQNAQRIARKMENIHTVLSNALEHIPEIKTNIVVVDNSDILFGGATHVFRNTIYISAVQIPVGIGHYDDFENNVLLHEYVHILDLDMMDDIPLYVRKVIGRFYTPNMFCPNWMIEGFATYLETEFTNGGRGRDPYYDMYLRMAFLDDKVEGISTFSPVNDKWSSSDVPYIYGESVYRFMGSGEEGSQKVIEFRERNSRKFIPFNFWGRFNTYWNGNLKAFYHDWKSDMNSRYSNQYNDIQKKRQSDFNQLTQHGFDTWGLSWSVDDKDIFYIKNDYDSHQALMRYNLENKKLKKLTNINSLYSDLHVDKNNDLWFNQYNIYNKTSIFLNTYKYDNHKNKKREVEGQERVLYSCTDSSGNIYYVTLEKGLNGLFKKDRNGEEEALIEPSESMFIANPEVSPDNRYIAFDLWEEGGTKDIYLFDLSQNKLIPLTYDKAWDLTPTWNLKGDQVIFSSDRSGVYNLFSVDIYNRSIKKLTNMVGGAFCPDISNKGNKIAFLNYSSKGFDVCTMDFPDLSKVSPYKMQTDTLFYKGWTDKGPKKPQVNEFQISKEKPYTPIPGLIQNIRFPYMYAYDTNSLTFGVTMFGSDVIGRHSYQLNLGVDVLKQQFSYYLMYQNSFFYPDFTFFVGDQVNPVWVLEDGESVLRGIKTKSYGTHVSIPFNKVDWAINAFAGISFNETENIDDLENKPQDVIEGRYNNLEAGIIFSNVKGYRRSVSMEEGIEISGTYNRLSASQYAQENIEVIGAELKKYTRIPFTRHHVLYTSVSAGKSNLKENIDQILLTDSLRSYGLVEWNNQKLGGVAEYRLPILRIEKGISLLPFYFRKVFASVYSEYWNFDKNGYIQKIGVNGIELHLSTYLFYNYPVIITGGYQHPWLDEMGKRKNSFYFTLQLNMTL